MNRKQVTPEDKECDESRAKTQSIKKEKTNKAID